MSQWEPDSWLIIDTSRGTGDSADFLIMVGDISSSTWGKLVNFVLYD